MIRFLLFLCVFISHFPAQYFSQNLILNPSFEDFENCPTNVSQVNPPAFTGTAYCTDWSKPTWSTSDYYHECYDHWSNLVDVPINFAGYQYPRTGSAYMGFYAMSDSYYPGTEIAFSYREYLQGKISVPLTSGHTYYCSFWVSVADDHGKYVVDRLGAKFINDAYYDDGITGLIPGMTPDFTSVEYNYFDDEINWMVVDGKFTAAGGEQWIIIGNFFGFFETNFLMNKYTDDPISHFSYYYLDDICLVDLDSTPNTSTYFDTTICRGDTLIFFPTVYGDYEIIMMDGSSGSELRVYEEGVYWIKSLDKSSCTFHTDSFIVRMVPHDIIPQYIDTLICPKDTIVLGWEYPFAIHYEWNTGDTTSSISANSEGLYIVQYTSKCGDSYIDSFSITHEDSINFRVEPKDLIACEGEEIEIKALDIYGTNISFQWSTGDYGTSTVIEHSGTYILTAHDYCMNRAADTVTVYFTDCDNCFSIPNAFSPNNDGINDIFKPLSLCGFSRYNFSIYNRWGERIFYSHKLEDGWNGTYQNQPVEAGVYFYYLEAQPVFSEKPINIKGDVTLIR